VIAETGLCVWRSGAQPTLHLKRSGDFLRGHMALFYCGVEHVTPSMTDCARDLDMIAAAGRAACDAVLAESLHGLAAAIRLSCRAQLDEGMTAIEQFEGALAQK
jgi:hypothetical protein